MQVLSFSLLGDSIDESLGRLSNCFLQVAAGEQLACDLHFRVELFELGGLCRLFAVSRHSKPAAGPKFWLPRHPQLAYAPADWEIVVCP